MPQLFQVLRCYKCFVFQVHQTKKSNKWECKLCGEKQSIKRHYGLGTAKDCRLQVQKLNGMRGEIDQLKTNKDLESDNSDNEENVTQPIKDNYIPVKDSKWSNYIEEMETLEENTNENMSLGDAQVILELPKKRRKLNINNSKRNPKVTTALDHRKIHEKDQNDIVSNLTPVTVPKTIVNKVSIESKITQQCCQFEDMITEGPIKKLINLKDRFIPSVLNKNSKWAQFTEDPEESEQTDISPSPTIEMSHNDLLFSLCDDTDLDNVLNI